jgi:hypothetical protein
MFVKVHTLGQRGGLLGRAGRQKVWGGMGMACLAGEFSDSWNAGLLDSWTDLHKCALSHDHRKAS